MSEGRAEHEVSTRAWAVWLTIAAVVFLVAMEAEQHPIAIAAAALGALAIFGLLWRLLALPHGVRQVPPRWTR